METDLKALAEFVAELKGDQALDRVPTPGVLMDKDMEKPISLACKPIDFDHEVKKSAVVKYPTIETQTLQSIVDFFGGAFTDRVPYIEVASPISVRVLGKEPLYGGGRDCYLVAQFHSPVFPFATYQGIEAFVTNMLSYFVPNDDSKALLAMLGGGVKITAARQVADDGTSTQLKRERGVVCEWSEPAKPHWSLAARCTFPEIEQPERLCSFRVKSNSEDDPVKVALFDSDGEAWRMKAIASIGAYLTEKIPDATILK